MKSLLLSTTLCLAVAGAGYAETRNSAQKPDMTAQQLRDDMMLSSHGSADPSGAGLIIPLAFLIVLVAVLNSSGGGSMNAGYYHSDARLKTDIKRVGRSPSGLPIHEFRYRGHSERFRGVLTQDVARHQPKAVARDAQGVLMVDYGQIDVPLELLR